MLPFQPCSVFFLGTQEMQAALFEATSPSLYTVGKAVRNCSGGATTLTNAGTDIFSVNINVCSGTG